MASWQLLFLFRLEISNILANRSVKCYFLFQVTCEGTDRTLNLDWERVRIFDKEVAQMFVGIIKSADTARYVRLC